jgi:cytochrome c oxidase subunit 3
MSDVAIAGRGAARIPEPGVERDSGRFGMWVFLASEVLFFGGLFIAYAYGRLQWPAGWGIASHHTDVLIGTLNTAVLLTSSALVALAVVSAEQERPGRTTEALLAASALLGVAFLVLKGIEWHDDWRQGLVPGPGFALRDVPGAAEFFVLYFVMTGLHGVHVTAGIGVLGAFAFGRHRHRAWADARRIDVGALYWHFVDIVWIFLYPLIYLVLRHD